MAIELLTKEDLEQFKIELFEKLDVYLNKNSSPDKPLLKSKDVRKILGISPGTLQTLRVNRVLNPNKVLGTLYYDREEVTKLFHSNKK